MRVDPDLLESKSPAWRAPLLLAFLLAFLAFPAIKNPGRIFSSFKFSAADREKRSLDGAEAKTVAVAVRFESLAPSSGARIALTMANPHGDSLIVVEDAWVAKSTGRDVVLRLAPQEALILQSAKNFGNFNFIEISAAGESPYVGQGVQDSEQLGELLTGTAKVATAVKDSSGKKQRAYAWVPGDGIRYGIEGSGPVKAVGQ